MPEVSQRGQNAPESPIRKLVPFAEHAQAQGRRVYFLNIGQPDIEPPTEFWQGIEQMQSRMVPYSHSLGNAGLRSKMRQKYAGEGIDLHPNELIVTTAGSEALLFAMLACFEPGDEVIVPEPMYANYIGFAAMAGVVVKPIRTRIETGFALPTVQEFADQLTPKTKGILICNPNNPTGAVYSWEQLQSLRDFVVRNDLYLFADEVYREFYYNDRTVTSVLSLEGANDHIVVADSVSKRFSLCGARVGFLMTRNPVVMSAATRFAQARLCPPTIEQFGVEAACLAGPEYFDGVREEYKRRRDTLVEGLRSIPGVICPDVEGAFYLMTRFPIDNSDAFCKWLLEEFEHEGQTVMMAPGTGFYATPEAGLDECRLAYVLNCEDLKNAIEVLRAAVAVYPGRKVLA